MNTQNNDSLEKLLRIAGPSLLRSEGILHSGLHLAAGQLRADLAWLLRRRNGFYAFESALHVFPTETSGLELGLEEWNSADLWRTEYGDLADGCLFFAEDVFGGQFCIRDNTICHFNPEEGSQDLLAASLNGWASLILADYRMLTGFPLAHKWQEKNGPIPPGKRLVPKIPFVAGGAYSLDNLYALESAQGMRLRGSMARQIRHLPNGSKIMIEWTD